MSWNARPVNPPWAPRAAVKPGQLELARRAGLRVPDTLITNDRHAACHPGDLPRGGRLTVRLRTGAGEVR